jgi:hypothetical protein
MRSKSFVWLGGGGLAVASSVSMALPSGGTDYSSILIGLDTSTAITAIVGAGALLAGVGFARWATKKVAGFFG